jgi:hypothetical protein
MSLPDISEEQQNIVTLVSDGFNVQVDAVAGSGKTTTSLYIAKNNSFKQILLLTYNAKLKLETRDKTINLNITNMEVHSYHAFCVKYFNHKAFKDNEILTLLKKKVKPLKKFNYDIIIIDEAQDMNPIYYELVLYIYQILEMKPQLIIMGDRKQSIYAFNKADNRFLTFADKIYESTNLWKNASLSVSYRITKQMASFLNECCNGALPIVSYKPGVLVKYVICNTFENKPSIEIENYLSIGYKPEQIFILAPSVKTEGSPIRHLANRLTQRGIPIYVPTSDEEKLDEDILNGKIVFSTFHQVKGLERDVVIVYNFDDSYFEFYAKDVQDKTIIPNTLYVAITRAKKSLTVIHDESNNYLEFINKSLLHNYVRMDISSQFYTKMYRNQDKKNKPTQLQKMDVTELIKFIPVDILHDCLDLLEIELVSTDTKDKKLKIPMKTKQEDLYEGVSEINGVAIPSLFELKVSGKMSITQHITQQTMMSINSNIKGTSKCLLNSDEDSDEDQYKINKYDLSESAIENLLKLSTEWVCSKSGYNFKKNQITEYNWLSSDILEKSMDRMLLQFPKETHHLLKFEIPFVLALDNFVLVGFADLMYNKNIYEIKVVSEIDPVYYIQLAVYTWLAIKLGYKIESSYLYNIIDGFLYKLNYEINNLNKLVKTLIETKKNGLIEQSNDIFLNKCNEIKKKFIIINE